MPRSRLLRIPASSPPIAGLKLLWRDEFIALNMRSGGDQWSGYGTLDTAYAAGTGIYEGVSWFAPSDLGVPYNLDSQRAFDTNPNYAWPGGYKGQVANFGGTLRLRTEPTPVAIQSLLPVNPRTGQRFDYVSASLTTRNSINVKPPFYIESRIKFPKGLGVWPAFWMVGTARGPNTGSAPNVEIDIAEYFPNPNQSNKMFTALHYNTAAAPTGTYKQVSGGYTAVVDLSLDYHVYGAYVTPTSVGFYLDGVLMNTLAIPADMPMDQFWQIILDNGLADADYTGVPDGSITTANPCDMLVDYIRLWGDQSTNLVLNRITPTIVVTPTLTIAGANGTATVGDTLSFTPSISGGTPPYNVVATNLEAGRSVFNTATGLTTGAYTTAGSYNVVYTVTDSKGVTASFTRSVTVSPAAAATTSALLREDGSYLLREDGSRFLREDA